MAKFPLNNVDYSRLLEILKDQLNDVGYSDVQLDSNAISEICEYLENPTKTGVWFLTSEWINEGEIASHIEKEIKNLFIPNESNQINEKNDPINKINVKSSLFENKDEFLETINRFSFIFSLFTYIHLKEMGDKEIQISKKSPIVREIIKNFQEILQSLNLDEIKAQFHDAYEFFENEIYFDGFYPFLYEKKIFKIKDGFILLNYKKKNDNLSLSSLSYSPLEKVKDFFIKIGTIKDYKIRPEYSPEEKVFTPYFSFVEEAYPYFIHDVKVANLFKKAIGEYKDSNYEYCISTLGLIAEDYLTQIYETYHREPIPKKLTIGQTYDLINSKINNQFPSNAVQAPNITLLYNKLNDLLSNFSEADEIEYNKKIAELIREILSFVQEDKKHTKYLIDNINKQESKISLFPKYLKENINEIIKNRNATSHNSRIPIGQYEAQKTVYCCITLIMWWKKEKDAIDWKDDQKDIIQKTIERNKSSK